MTKWYVLYIKPKAEKKVALRLERLGFESFCPLITETHQWSDRKKKVEIPMFPSYVFVRLQEKDRNKVFEVSGVVRYLYWLGRPATIQNTEIETIRGWLQRENEVSISVENLTTGDRVTILSGALKNEEAIIKEMGPRRIRLILVKLGCSVCAETKDILKKTGTSRENFN